MIKEFERLSGKSLIRLVGQKNRPQSYVDFVLALRVLQDYDVTFS